MKVKKQQKKNYDKSEVYIAYFSSFIWLNTNLTIALKGELYFKGVYFTGLHLYGFPLIISIILVSWIMFSVDYLIQQNTRILTKRIIAKEFIKSPFFAILVAVFLYQNFSFNYFNKYILFTLYVPFFYYQYEYFHKMENYDNEHQK